MKKFLALFLVCSFLILQGNVYAEKKGAELIVQKREGTQFRGELIAIRENSLLLMERESGADISVDIEEIKTIIVVKKPKPNYGFFGGLLVGGALGGYVGATMYGPGEGALAIMLGVLGAVAFASLGGLVFGTTSPDETIRFEGKTDAQIQAIWKELHKLARIKNL
jgi:hypothetical protein